MWGDGALLSCPHRFEAKNFDRDLDLENLSTQCQLRRLACLDVRVGADTDYAQPMHKPKAFSSGGARITLPFAVLCSPLLSFALLCALSLSLSLRLYPFLALSHLPCPRGTLIQSGPQTLTAALEKTAASYPDRGLTLYSADGTERLTFAQLLEQAQKISAGLCFEKILDHSWTVSYPEHDVVAAPPRIGQASSGPCSAVLQARIGGFHLLVTAL